MGSPRYDIRAGLATEGEDTGSWYYRIDGGEGWDDQWSGPFRHHQEAVERAMRWLHIESRATIDITPARRTITTAYFPAAHPEENIRAAGWYNTVDLSDGVERGWSGPWQTREHAFDAARASVERMTAPVPRSEHRGRATSWQTEDDALADQRALRRERKEQGE